jgi:hypothetical protein
MKLQLLELLKLVSPVRRESEGVGWKYKPYISHCDSLCNENYLANSAIIKPCTKPLRESICFGLVDEFCQSS